MERKAIQSKVIIMKSIDFNEFADVWTGAWELVGRNITSRAVMAAFELLGEFEIVDIKRALAIHAKSKQGREPPKPADIADILAVRTHNGHPGPDEAWGILVKFVGNEAETGVLTEEIRRGWEACSGILDLGDEVGARRCFLEVYTAALAEARQHGRPPQWTVSLGTCPNTRKARIEEAVRLGRLKDTDAAGYLPPPKPTAALADLTRRALGGPPDQGAKSLQNHMGGLRALSERLRTDQAAAERRRREAALQAEREAAERLREELHALTAEAAFEN